jgi:DNA-binding NarL/FixJ family response regulator
MKPVIKILVLDKEEIIFKAVKRALKDDQEFQYEITYSTTAFEGLKYIRSSKFDLVLIDLVLPGMNAFEALRRIKNIDPKLRVVVMSGFIPSFSKDKDDTGTNEDSFANASGFLLKPFTTDEIKSLILRILKIEKMI